ALDVEPGRLDRVEERLFALRAMARKLNVLVEDLPATRAKMAHALSEIEDAEGALRKLKAEVAEAQTAFYAAIEALRARRLEAGAALSAAVMAELTPLKLDRAAFRVDIRPLEP